MFFREFHGRENKVFQRASVHMTHIIIIYNFSLIEWMQNDKIVQKSVSQSSNCKAIPITLYNVHVCPHGV